MIAYWFGRLMCSAGYHWTGTKREGMCERTDCYVWVRS